MTGTDLLTLMPYLILAGAIILGMILIAIKRNHALFVGFSLFTFVAAFLSLFWTVSFVPNRVTTLFVIDGYTLFFLGLLFAASFLVVLISYGYLISMSGNREEYYLLIFLATFGSGVLVASNHFASIFLGLEILSVSLYTLIAYLRTSERSIEASIKYLILAASSSAFLLFGMALIYADSGAMEFSQLAAYLAGGRTGLLILTGFSLIIVGVGFKLAIVPFHLWTPDVYQGAPAPVTAFVATVSKGGVFALLIRFFLETDAYQYESLLLIFTIIAIASMFFGNLLALMQNNVKRILAYSSIAHLGYLLVAFIAGRELGVEAVGFYLVAYFITTIGAFGIITILSSHQKEAEHMEDYQGLFWNRPLISAIFTAMMFSLAGIPLTAGFVGKFYVVSAGVNASLWLLVILLVLNSAIGLFYYLRIVVAMYSHPAEGAEAPVIRPSVSIGAGLALGVLTLMLVWFGVYPESIMALIQSMVSGLTQSYPSIPIHTGLF